MVNDETPKLLFLVGRFRVENSSYFSSPKWHSWLLSLRAEIRTNMTYDDRKIVSCCDMVGWEHR